VRDSTIFLRKRTRLPVAPAGEPSARPLEVVVPYTNPSLAAQALSAALELAKGFEAAVTLMAVYVLPYPAPLEASEGIRQRLETDLTAVARTSPVSVRVKLVFARDRDEAYLCLLQRQSLVVVGCKARWWKTREERFATTLAAHGHSVAVIKMRS